MGILATIAPVVLLAAAALAQTQYGENHATVNFDSQLVEQTAFPEPNVTLYSPAFLSNASFDPGWTQGTEGATAQDDLGTEPSEIEHRTIDKTDLTMTQTIL